MAQDLGQMDNEGRQESNLGFGRSSLLVRLPSRPSDWSGVNSARATISMRCVKRSRILHLSVDYPPMMRHRGDLVPLDDHPRLRRADVERYLYEIVTPQQRAHFDREWDIDFAYAYADKARFRANYMMKTTGMGAVFRTIPTKILTLDDLNVPQGIRKLCELRAGLLLVTGPTGSGKSTTLAAMVDHINESRNAHILTIEDRWSSFIAPSAPRSPTARWENTRRRSSRPSAAPGARTPTSSSSASFGEQRPCGWPCS